jgi:hypothetical protein
MSETEFRMVFDGEGATRRHARTECAEYVAYYAGPRGSERLVRMAFNNGQVKLFEGARGMEHKVQTQYPNGTSRTYDGPPGQERRVEARFTDGTVKRYGGARGSEHVEQVKFSDGQVVCYEGPAGCERKVQVRFPGGQRELYAGPKGQERLVDTFTEEEVAAILNEDWSEAPAPPPVPPSLNASFALDRAMQAMARAFANGLERVGVQGAPQVARVAVPRPGGTAASESRKRKLSTTMQVLEGLNDDGHCNEHAYKQMADQLMKLYAEE